MKYAIIGTSWISEEYVKAAKYATGCVVKAVYSRDVQKGIAFAQKTGAKEVFTSLTSLAHCEDIDAVYIASPNSLHYEQSRLMLENSKHVICEKPAASSPEEIYKLIGIAQKNKLVYMEAIMFLYLPELELLKKALTKIGHISSANLDFSQLSSKYTALRSGKLPNIFNPEFHTGCLMDIGVYNIYMALELFGIPDKVTSSSNFLNTGADGSGAAILDYDNKQVTLTYSKTGQSRAPSQIFGDNGTILINSVSQLGNIKIIYNDGSSEQVCCEKERTYVMSFEAAAFHDFIDGKNISKLEYAQQLSLNVADTMKTIRAQNAAFLF